MWTTLISLCLALSGKAPHARTPRRRPALRPPSSRPHLEPLEDRLTPATLTWTGSVSQSWSNPANWAEGVTPYMTPLSDDLIFPRGGVVHKVSNHDQPVAVVIKSITFEDSGYTLTGGVIDFFVGHIINSPGVDSNTIQNAELSVAIPNAPQILIECLGNSTLNVSSNIVGPGGLVKIGSGALRLSGVSSYRAGTRLLEGTLIVGRDSSLGVGRLQLFGGTLQSIGQVTLANPLDVTNGTIGGFQMTFTGSVEISSTVRVK